MNKVKLVVVAAVLAAPMTVAVVDTAEAHGPRLSRLFRVAHTLRVIRHAQPRVHVYRSTTYRETTYRGQPTQRRDITAAPKKTAQNNPSPAAVGVRQADAGGRVYDPASMVWFDGVSQCWTGTQPWSFKSNAWYYGSSRWYPANGGWQTDTADPPASVSCQTVPTFAAVTPPPQEIARFDASDTPAPEKVVETKSVRPPIPAPAAARPANCRKYFAVIGETVSVPCDPSATAPDVEPVIPAANPQPAPAPVRVAEPAPPAHAPAAAPAASERSKEVVRVKAKRRATRDSDDD